MRLSKSGRPPRWANDMEAPLSDVSGNSTQPGKAAEKTCPSRACEEGVALLGVMTPSGHLAYINPSRLVDADFVAKARSQGRPESRFRFSGPCVEDSCPQWTGSACRIADVVTKGMTDGARARRLPACTIRPSCRWFSQRGRSACTACPTIVADIGGTRTHRLDVIIGLRSPQ
jgi:hypothetical protein